MKISDVSRNKVRVEIEKFIDKSISNDVELSIYNFSVQYAEQNNTPYLVQNIYDSKSEEIIYQLKDENSTHLISGLKEKNIIALDVAFMKPEEINPEKYENYIKKREMEEHKKLNKVGSTAFKCSKCNKSNCSVTQKQTRAGDEPPTTFISCNECHYTFKFN
jgi:DNA-directed RNA polymerase subunit M/transcription elongation factor TFIIS